MTTRNNDQDERRDVCTCCNAAPIMGFDTPSGVLCCDCANDLHHEDDCTPRGRPVRLRRASP